jgi:hypothetical protein
VAAASARRDARRAFGGGSDRRATPLRHGAPPRCHLVAVAVRAHARRRIDAEVRVHVDGTGRDFDCALHARHGTIRRRIADASAPPDRGSRSIQCAIVIVPESFR